MTVDNTNLNGMEQLTLRSQLSELAQIPPWIEHLASQQSIPEETQFAINLCLEEALSNIVRHGCAGAPDRTIVVRHSKPGNSVIFFVVEDDAPPFNPMEAPEPQVPNSIDDLQVGGQGIRLLRRFADTLKYERTHGGNRLSMGFSIPPESGR